MKTIALLILFITRLTVCAQEDEPEGYVFAPSLSIKGDFDGDGLQDIFSQFVVDSLGNKIDHVATSDDVTDYIMYPEARGYSNAFTLNDKITVIDNYIAIGLYCLINLGDINTTKGDEIALVPDLLDESALNTCRIYSYCNNQWIQVYSFSVNERAFNYEGVKSVFTNIPSFLEKRNGLWYFRDYIKSINKTKEIPMKQLNVSGCK